MQGRDRGSRAAAVQELEAKLGGNLPTSLGSLSAEELRDLAEAIDSARHRQARSLHEASENAWGYIPRLIRGPIRKIVG